MLSSIDAKDQSDARDRAYWELVCRVTRDCGYTLEDVLKYWPAYVLRRDQVRFLAHYELFKMVLDRPGCFVDVGVFRGASLFTWSNLLEIFAPFDRNRQVFGFDSFEGLTDITDHDAQLDSKGVPIRGTYRATEQEITALVAGHNADAMIPAAQRVHLVVGNVAESIPQFVAENPGARISLLHLDLDLYEPTKVALKALWPMMVKGGIVALDEYAEIDWPGESRAVDEFLATLSHAPQILKFPFARKPCYIVK